jgi:hypothetical protein
VNPGGADVTRRVDQRVELIGDDTVAIQRDNGDLHDAVLALEAGRFHIDDGDPVAVTKQCCKPATRGCLRDGRRSHWPADRTCPLDSVPPPQRSLLPRICIPTSYRHTPHPHSPLPTPTGTTGKSLRQYREAGTRNAGSTNSHRRMRRSPSWTHRASCRWRRRALSANCGARRPRHESRHKSLARFAFSTVAGARRAAITLTED